jgi:hypothetical protein
MIKTRISSAFAASPRARAALAAILALGALPVLAALPGCGSGGIEQAAQNVVFRSEVRSATGTVKFQSLEGGFWGIKADDNTAYDPINLPAEFKVEGKRVSFTFQESESVSFHQWGKLIQINTITAL